MHRAQGTSWQPQHTGLWVHLLPSSNWGQLTRKSRPLLFLENEKCQVRTASAGQMGTQVPLPQNVPGRESLDPHATTPTACHGLTLTLALQGTDTNLLQTMLVN